MRYYKEKIKRGFTFVELVVVIFIYSLLLAGAVDIFVSSQRAQRKVAALEKLQDDARFLIQAITQAFQSGGLDYSCYTQGQGQPCKTNLQDKPMEEGGLAILAVKNFEGRTIQFKHSTDASLCANLQSTPCLLVSDNDGATWVPGSSEGVKVETLRFYIAPSKNPFELGEDNEYLAHQQPRLTVVFEATAAIKGFKETANIMLQTTISSREYKR